MSDYRLQVLHVPSGSVVGLWMPGGAVEIDLIEDVVSRATAKGVGLFRTEAMVGQAIREAMQESLRGVKERVKP